MPRGGGGRTGPGLAPLLRRWGLVGGVVALGAAALAAKGGLERRRLESQRDPAIRVASGVTNGWRIDYLPDPPPRRADAPVTLDALHVPVGGVGLDEAVNRCRELRDYPPQNASAIPSKIWTFWDSQELPSIVRTSIESWRRSSPDWEVIVLDTDTIADYGCGQVAELEAARSHPQRLAEFVRVCVVEQHGGVWIDATSFMAVNLNWVHAVQRATGADLIAYRPPDWGPTVFEVWFFAAVPKRPLITAWRREFFLSAEFPSVRAYLDDREPEYGMFDLRWLGRGNKGLEEYLVSYYPLHMLSQDKALWGTAKLFNSVDGPFYLAHSYLGMGRRWKILNRWLGATTQERYLRAVKAYVGGRVRAEGSQALTHTHLSPPGRADLPLHQVHRGAARGRCTGRRGGADRVIACDAMRRAGVPGPRTSPMAPLNSGDDSATPSPPEAGRAHPPP